MTGRFNLEIEGSRPMAGSLNRPSLSAKRRVTRQSSQTRPTWSRLTNARSWPRRSPKHCWLTWSRCWSNWRPGGDEIVDRRRSKIRAETQAKRSGPAASTTARKRMPRPRSYANSDKCPTLVRREAEEALRDPSLMERVVADLELLGVAGEVSLKATLYLVFTSRKLSRPLSSRAPSARPSSRAARATSSRRSRN